MSDRSILVVKATATSGEVKVTGDKNDLKKALTVAIIRDQKFRELILESVHDYFEYEELKGADVSHVKPVGDA